MGLELENFPCASPEVIWASTAKSSRYVKGRIISKGADTHCYASSEPGNLRSLHIARDTGNNKKSLRLKFIRAFQGFVI